MAKIRVIADDRVPFLKGVLEPFCSIRYLPANEITNKTVSDADALFIRTRTVCNRALLENTSVKFIATATIGFDHIDTDYCLKNNIHWVNAPGCNAASVGQYIAAAILQSAEELDLDLSSKTIGIVGVGNVGAIVAHTSKILGLHTLLNDPPRERKEGPAGFSSLEVLLAESDIISLHVPITYEGEDSTYHLVNQLFFDQLDKAVIYCNSSRGKVNESSAVLKAVTDKKIKLACSDVWEKEPAMDEKLLQSSYIATPHVAGYSLDGKANGTAMAVRAFSKFSNLGLDSWHPNDIPLPAKPFITIDCQGKADQDILKIAVLHSYDILKDSNYLKSFPLRFEAYRNDYPPRREFNAFTVDLINERDEIKEKLINLGFKLHH